MDTLCILTDHDTLRAHRYLMFDVSSLTMTHLFMFAIAVKRGFLSSEAFCLNEYSVYTLHTHACMLIESSFTAFQHYALKHAD